MSMQITAPGLELPSILAKEFSVSSRNRGDEYFRLKRVKVHIGSSAEVSATVNGMEPYEVLLKVSGTKLSVSCTCPYFLNEGQNCKHIWASILTADEQGYLSDAAAGKDTSLNPDTIGEQSSGLFPAPIKLVRAAQAVTPIKPPPPPPPPPPPRWKTQMGRIVSVAASYRTEASPWPAHKEIVYLLDVPKSQGAHGVVLTIAMRERKKDGGWKSIPRPFSVQRARIAALPLVEDRELLSMLLGGEQYSSYGYLESYDRGPTTFSLSSVTAETILPRVLRTGRCLLPLEGDGTDKSPLQWDDGEPWRFVLEVRGSQREGWQLSGSFRRGPQRMGIDEPLLVIPGGFLFTQERVARLAEDETFPWIAGLRNNNAVVFSEEEREEFFSSLICSPALPLLDLPEALQYEELTLSPRKCLKITQPRSSYKNDRMRAEVSFEYGGRSVPEHAVARGIYEAGTRRFFRRDVDAEKAAWTQLSEVGLRYVEGGWTQDAGWNLAPTKLPRVVRALVESGWHVVAEGKAFRQPGQSSVSVSSGVDWFELHGAIEYGDTSAPLPQLLAALKRGETMVTLGDGSYGLLPEEWLRRFGPVAAMGEAEGDHIRFGSNQAGVLDALLATQPAVDCDEAFRRVRQELARFQSISAAEQPAGFQGRLRDYQRDGLGWMHFLRQFSFGGCLADDMGVGKTAQVLALLETRRELRAEGKIDAPRWSWFLNPSYLIGSRRSSDSLLRFACSITRVLRGTRTTSPAMTSSSPLTELCDGTHSTSRSKCSIT
jgi:Bacterial SNF2 helicase associated